ncbi:MAG: hypothetical protein KZQ97_09425 [Candidatus Thiodiazotropha sp. (ex Dulcina madagascariensis)]|nr:hypothetical protein [Candidatus Thiodiazotropha sp. (ex Dulcina madagascariensis)]
MDNIKGKLAKHRGKLLVIALLVVTYYVLIVRNPLPSDEDMIAHFQAHRSDIEELVRRYRNYSSDPKVDHSLWFKEEGTQEILRRAGVEDISRSAYSPWLPNPYSIETANTIKNEIRNGNGYALLHNYGALRIKPAPRRLYYSSHLRYANIWKDYYFIPEISRIENGELLWPVNTKGKYSARDRVLYSLDGFPDEWKDFECVFRQVETHWFLRMCNGH